MGVKDGERMLRLELPARRFGLRPNMRFIGVKEAMKVNA